MPRKNAGHTGQPSRNPAGRGSQIEGRKVVASYTLTVERKQALADLAEASGRTASAFLDGLIAHFAQDFALELIAVRNGAAALLEGNNAEGDDVDGGPAAAAAVPGERT